MFKIETVCHLGTLKFKFVTAAHFRGMFCAIALNYVEISLTVVDILRLFAFL